ncbi:MAG: PEP-CTERM sorting domain-containing protein [Verrucomicrobiota bacterium]
MAPVSPASYTGTTWNNHVTTFGNNAINNLFSADGDASAVSVALTNNGVFSFTGGLDVVANYAFTPSTAAQTMTFSGLTSGSIWDLYIVSQGDQAGQGGTFLLDTTENISAGSAPAASTWTEGGNYVLFSGIEIGGTGEFTIDWSSNGAFGVVNGLQLVAVPEPSTYAMVFGAAVLGFCVIRRRQRK